MPSTRYHSTVSPYTLIHRLLRRLHQRNRLVGVSPATGTTLLQNHLLLELDADPSLSVSSLSALLGIDQGYCSRVCAGLAESGLLRITAADADARRKRLEVTRAGFDTIAAVDIAANSRFQEFSQSMSNDAKQDVVMLFRSIADGYGEPVCPARKGEHPYRAEQRRITRAFGLLGDRVFESSLTGSAWQLLSEVALAPVPVTPADLSGVLTLPPTTVSSLVSKFVKLGLVTREPARSDRRSIEIMPSDSGGAMIRDIEKRAVRRLRDALKSIPPTRLDRWVESLRRLVGQTDPDELLLPPDLTVDRITGDAERRALRTSLARTLVRLRREDQLPELTVSREREVWRVTRGTACIAVFEVLSTRREEARSIVTALALPGASAALTHAIGARIRRSEF